MSTVLFRTPYLLVTALLRKVSWLTVVENDLKAPFSIVTTPRCRRGRYSFPWIAFLTLDQYLIMLSVKQGGIKYHFLSLWYDSIWDWTLDSRTVGEHSNHSANTTFLINITWTIILQPARCNEPRFNWQVHEQDATARTSVDISSIHWS